MPHGAAASGGLADVSALPQRTQFLHPASTGSRHCGHATRTAVPQLAQYAWPFRAGRPQAGQGTGTGSRRMK